MTKTGLFFALQISLAVKRGIIVYIMYKSVFWYLSLGSDYDILSGECSRNVEFV